MMMLQKQVQKNATFLPNLTQAKLVDIAKGIGVAALGSGIPFALSFAFAHFSGFTAANYPAVEPIAAATGLGICLTALPIALEMKNLSVEGIVASSSSIFLLLGLLAALTV